jgi:hypothetical protein
MTGPEAPMLDTGVRFVPYKPFTNLAADPQNSAILGWGF